MKKSLQRFYYAFRYKILYSDFFLSRLLKKYMSKAKHFYLYRSEKKANQNTNLHKDGSVLIMGILFDGVFEQYANLLANECLHSGVRPVCFCDNNWTSFSDIPFIIIGYPEFLEKYPKTYFELEILNCSVFNNKAHYEILEKAGAVLFTNLTSFERLQAKEYNSIQKKSYYLPFPDAETSALEQKAFSFYFNRFLLSHDFISFNLFYELAGRHFISLPENNRVCLNLPESINRKKEFEQENKFGFSIIPGIKHRIGWVGCALSYKMLFRKSLEENKDRIFICEDDVSFPVDFEEKISHISNFLDKRTWDVFSGVMADSHDMHVTEVNKMADVLMLKVDKMVSTVFNIYNKNIIEIGANWNEVDRRKDVNAIDGYLGKNASNVYVLVPFLVKHKEDLDSVIWNVNNAQYSYMISGTEKKLRDMASALEAQ